MTSDTPAVAECHINAETPVAPWLANRDRQQSRAHIVVRVEGAEAQSGVFS